MKCYKSFMLVNLFVLIAFTAPIRGMDSRKLDESTGNPTQPDVKCTTCNPSPPPPSPPPPSPPPPVLCPPPPSPPAEVQPPPTPKKPPSSYCPPPPPSFIYITGPPGNLYPIDNDFNGATRAAGFGVLIGCGLLGLLVRFGF